MIWQKRACFLNLLKVTLNSKEMKEFDKLITVDENLKEITEMITVYEERGIEIGLRKGRLEGILQNAKNAVLEALEVKFGTVPYPIKEKVLYCDDLNKLKQAHRTAILIDSISKFNI
jgi:hypothetical protein